MGKNNNRILTLNKVKEFLSTVYENSDAVHWLSSPDLSQIHYVSPAYEKIWGRSREIIYSNRDLWVNYLHPDERKDRQLFNEFANQAAKEPHAHYRELYRIVRPDKQIRYILDQGYPVFNEEKQCCGLTGTALDITEQRLTYMSLSLPTSLAELTTSPNKQLIVKIRDQLTENLTDREIECLGFWLAGYSMKATANFLTLSLKTVEAYRTNIKHKLGVHHKFQLIELIAKRSASDLCLALGALLKEGSFEKK